MISGLISSEFYDGVIRIKDKNFKFNLKVQLDFSDNNKIINVSSKVLKINFR